ncbi:MAG: fibrobacter succinogenes major paralogous domain-containing protein [Saprospiraceae bacterium]|nr:fibrobacter succinogenes major paralogous domain-containing protein [Saprospiraceae bacterium]
MVNLLYSQASQPILLEVEGAIQIGHNDNPTPNPGTIRYNGADLQGYTPDGWISLTGVSYIYDIDNNRYETIKIGNQIWMAENLRSTRYNDGTPIQLITDNAAWTTADNAPAYTWYNNGPSAYGALYNEYVVSDTNSHNVCPAGWHIPSESEWNTLSSFLGGSSVAGGKMKQSGLEHWKSPNTMATNGSSFTGLPGGARNSYSGAFTGIGEFGGWWSNSLGTGGWIYYFLLATNNILDNYVSDPKIGLSVRCIKD